MKLPSRRSLVELTSDAIRDGLLQGHWGKVLPGIRTLSSELQVGKNTVEKALALLTRDGTLPRAEHGKRRRVDTVEKKPGRVLRTAILLHSPLEMQSTYTREMLVNIRERLARRGHDVVFVKEPPEGLGADPGPRLATMVSEAEASAWVLVQSPRAVIEWFSRQSTPAFCIGGFVSGLPIGSCGTSGEEITRDAARRLISTGHRRICMLELPAWQSAKQMGSAARAFCEELRVAGVKPGPFHLPRWEESPGALRSLLDQLFAVTPPTAMIVYDVHHLMALLGFLMERGLRIPQDVSVVVDIDEPLLEWFPVPFAKYHHPWDRLAEATVRWMGTVARGEPDVRQQHFAADFLPGESIAPPPPDTTPKVIRR